MDHERANIQVEANRDFSRARMKAFWSEVWKKMTGRSDDLLKFEDVERSLRLRGQRNLGLQNIPLEKIVGTVGRYNDFTRSFLPRKTVSQERWKQISALARGSLGFPPIEVYKVGEVYFVIDGNHRVSVARQLGQPTIEAFVIELPTPIPLDENTTADELAIREEYANFLHQTRLTAFREDANILLTESGLYPQIIQHIEVHRYFMGLDQQRDVEWQEAVISWYDNVYIPMVNSIHEHNILDEFPNRTAADLYVWLIHHQSALHDNYGGDFLSASDTARDFKERLE